MFNTWENTQLWARLQGRTDQGAEDIRSALRGMLTKIETVLASGATAPLDFTLHDEEHSFRVAERMVELIPDDVLPHLSIYEVALLLLSAYLHDIGMTPKRGRISSFRKWLLDGDASALEPDDISEIQSWLDDSGYGLVPPVKMAGPFEETLRVVDKILTYYCRHKHNDWSEEWVRENLATATLGTFHGWIDELITLCKSHHFGYDTLSSDRFNARLVATPAAVLNLRYLAAVLRVADVLDVDPERTPEAVLEHREIAPSSVIYWYKDHELTILLRDNKVTISARPTRAFVHKAVLDTVSGIETELGLCRRLADIGALARAIGPIGKLPHRWDIEPFVFSDLQPREGTYDYIEGAFRPNTRKVLELLSGTALYRDRMVAVREALQNSFDAVKERIAYQRLMQPDPNTEGLDMTLGNLNRVTLSVQEEEGRTWLIISDDGIGMTKAIIRDYFLVSGSPVRHQLLDLERQCTAKGFSLGRTGQFGIGALSYFMIADRVVITTRRAFEAGDAESTGWRFESDGIGSFGELRRDSTRIFGTELRMRIRNSVIEQTGGDWNNFLLPSIHRVIGRVPCRVDVWDQTGGHMSLGPGWARSHQQLAEVLVKQLEIREVVETELLSGAGRAKRIATTGALNNIAGEIVSRVKWMTVEGELADRTGRYRAHFPIFPYKLGNSLAYVFFTDPAEDSLEIQSIYSGNAFYPREVENYFWKGMAIGLSTQGSYTSYTSPLPPGFIVEVDFESPLLGELAVSRNSFVLTAAGETALQQLGKYLSLFRQTWVEGEDASPFTHLNRLLAGLAFEPAVPLHWFEHVKCSSKEGPGISWSLVTFPQSTIDAVIDGRKLRNRPHLTDPFIGGGTWSWCDNIHSADKLIVNKAFAVPNSEPYSMNPALFWERAPTDFEVEVGFGPKFVMASLSPLWHRVAGIAFRSVEYRGSRIVWNRDHILVKAATSESWQQAQNWVGTDPLKFRDSILKDSASAASFVLRFAQRLFDYDAVEIWNALSERDGNFLPEVWALAFGQDARIQGAWTRVLGVDPVFQDSFLYLSPDGIDEQTTLEGGEDPGSEWTYTLLG